jgi:hypothetical protein
MDISLSPLIDKCKLQGQPKIFMQDKCHYRPPLQEKPQSEPFVVLLAKRGIMSDRKITPGFGREILSPNREVLACFLQFTNQAIDKTPLL